MKRTISNILILILVLGLCSTAVYASPMDSDTVKNWVLSDNGVNIYVKLLQYPKATVIDRGISVKGVPVIQPVLQEITLEMDMEFSQKYFQSFKNGVVIPEIVLTGTNIYNIPSFKFTLNNCTVCGYTISELRKGKAMTAPKVAIRVGAEKIASEKTSANNSSLQGSYSNKLDMGKLIINGIEDSGTAVFSGFDCYSMEESNTAGAKTYGEPVYKYSELYVPYDQIGTLPNWLAGLDVKNSDLTGVNTHAELRFEYSSPTTAKKVILEADLTAVGQELKNPSDRMLAYYTFQVEDLDFTVTTADQPPTPVMTLSPVIVKAPSPMRSVESPWAGNWITTFGKMTLKQNGASVTGEYGNPVEILEGTASGSKLAGTWKDSMSTGKFEFMMSADGNTFTGTMYNATLGDRGTREWNGDRQ